MTATETSRQVAARLTGKVTEVEVDL